jgi:hypothetical protein
MTSDPLKRALSAPAAVAERLVKTARYGLIRLLNRPAGLRNGVDILDEDWDNLVLLDACRCDVFESVNPIDGVFECRNSKGSATGEFLQENFAGRSAHDTILVSSNAMVGANADALDLFKIVGLWGKAREETDHRETNVDPASMADPERVLEKAIELHERYPNKRLIVHFLPPHTPFLRKDGESLSDDSEYRTFAAVREGRVRRSEIEAVYRENVEYVLNYVTTLLDRINGKTVVTADHGELLGEGIPTYLRLLHPRWPFAERHKFEYAHYNGIRVPELIKIPWLEVGGERREIVAADGPAGVEMETDDLEEQLSALGYKT